MRRHSAHVDLAAAGYLILRTLPSALALPARSVLGVVRLAEWNAEPPPSLSAVVPIEFVEPEPRWVLKIGGSVDSAATCVSGTMRVEYPQAERLLSLSALDYTGFTSYTDIVTVDGKPSALVMNVDALLAVYRELDRGS